MNPNFPSILRSWQIFPLSANVNSLAFLLRLPLWQCGMFAFNSFHCCCWAFCIYSYSIFCFTLDLWPFHPLAPVWLFPPLVLCSLTRTRSPWHLTLPLSSYLNYSTCNITCNTESASGTWWFSLKTDPSLFSHVRNTLWVEWLWKRRIEHRAIQSSDPSFARTAH